MMTVEDRKISEEPLRILIIEDDDEDAFLIERTLATSDGGPCPIVDRVATARHAVIQLQSGGYDVALVDYRLGADDGVSFLREARRAGISTPAIFLTGHGDEDVAVGAMKAGAVDYFVKSRMKPEALVASVRYAGRMHRTRLLAEETERSLRDSEERFRRAIIDAPFPIMIHGDDEAVLLVSRMWSELTGYTPAERPTVSSWVGRAFPVKPEHAAVELARLYALEVRTQHGEWPVLTRQGNRLTWEFSSSPLGLLSDGRRLVITMASDVTARKRLERQFLEAQKMESVGRLAGGVAHDFNNLLTVIMAAGSDLLDGLNPGSELHRSAEQVVDAADRAASLTRQLLLFSRKQIPVRRLIDLNAVVLELDKLLTRIIGEHISVRHWLSSQVCGVLADPIQIEQIVMNLVVNARDAMPDGGNIDIVTESVQVAANDGSGDAAPAPMVRLTVTDNGLGMTPEVMSNAFEPFFTTKEVGKGSGLGLSTVYAIVQQLGGSVSVQSRIGHGTTFTVLIPRVEAQEAEFRAKLVRIAPVTGTETILVVDDDRPVRELLRKSLEGAGYAVIEAGESEAAVAACANHPSPIHLMLTDVVLPGMSGRRLAEVVRSIRPEMRVLCISGHTDDLRAVEEIREGRMAFLQKPFTPGALCRRVREVLDAPARREEA